MMKMCEALEEVSRRNEFDGKFDRQDATIVLLKQPHS